MAFRTQDDTDEVMNEINMTPLVDVMLVLLIIFIITVPVMKHSVNVDLPRAINQPENLKPEPVRLSVSANGDYYWNESQITPEELLSRLQTEAAKEPQPDLHIRGDKAVRYEDVAQALAAAQRAGLRKIGFVTDPQQGIARYVSNALPFQLRIVIIHCTAEDEHRTTPCQPPCPAPRPCFAPPPSRRLLWAPTRASTVQRRQRAPPPSTAAPCCRDKRRWPSATTARCTACRRPNWAS